MTFLESAHKAPYGPLFYGTITNQDLSHKPVAIKLVYDELGTHHYGVRVHKLLAISGYAPEFLGCSPRLEEAPVAYVMERLPENWITLFDLKEKAQWQHLLEQDVREAIGRTLKNILALLHEHGAVHGDFRANNIMIELDSSKSNLQTPADAARKVNVKVVDFDWAGQAGEVFYPPCLNPNIRWPGKGGSPIQLGHDKEMFESWWKDYLSF